MSHFERLATALSNLAEAIRGVAEELGRARESPPPIASEPLLPGDWELIEDQSSVPGEPSDYNATLRIAVEDGPPPTPEFCLSLARLKLRSARRNPEERAREAFVAGFLVQSFFARQLRLAFGVQPPPSSFYVACEERHRDQ